MSRFPSNVPDAEIEWEFEGTNFGSINHRKVLEQGVLQCLADYSCGHTLTQIMLRLQLIGKSGRVTKKGRKFLFSAFHDKGHA